MARTKSTYRSKESQAVSAAKSGSSRSPSASKKSRPLGKTPGVPSKRPSPSKGNGVEPPRMRKKPRWRPGTVATREVNRLQKGVEILFQHAPFERQVRQAMFKYAPDSDLRITKTAIKALEEAFQGHAIGAFIAADRVRLLVDDIPKKTLMRGHLLAANDASNLWPGRGRNRMLDHQYDDEPPMPKPRFNLFVPAKAPRDIPKKKKALRHDSTIASKNGGGDAEVEVEAEAQEEEEENATNQTLDAY